MKGICIKCKNREEVPKGFPCVECINNGGLHEMFRPIDKHQSDGSTAVSLLTKAASIMEERGKQYDQEGGERSMGKCVAAFNTITGQNLSDAEGWLLLQVLKDVRQWMRKGYHADSAEDCITYAALKAEAKSKEIDNEKN